jgi:hypothetical protein
MAQPQEHEKVWSLGYEVSQLKHALLGVRMLVDLVGQHRAQDAHDAQAAPWAASALLTLIYVRLEDLGGVLRGELDPARLWVSTNATDPAAMNHGEDVTFAPWTATSTRAQPDRKAPHPHHAAQTHDPDEDTQE